MKKILPWTGDQRRLHLVPKEPPPKEIEETKEIEEEAGPSTPGESRSEAPTVKRPTVKRPTVKRKRVEKAVSLPADPPLSALPKHRRPRERMLEHGEGALSDEELVAVLLRTGKPGQSAVAMAEELIQEHGGVGGLLWTDIRRLRRYGLGPAKAASIMAAVELGRRLAKEAVDTEQLMDRPATVARYLFLRYGKVDQEVMGALFVDMRNRLTGESEIFRGTFTRAAVEPRAILREALLSGAAGLLLFHTHPSGGPAPSQEDLEFTFRMAKACEVMGVRLMDHLVVGDQGAWVSLKDHGAW